MRIEGADGLAALEQAVAEGGDVDVVIIRPDGQIGVTAIVDHPDAVVNGGDVGFVLRIVGHAGGNGVVDPYRAVGALLRQQSRIGVAVFQTAVPGQVEVGYVGFGKRVGGDVDGRIQIKHHVVERRIREGTGADVLHGIAQIQLRAAGGLKRAVADVLHRGGQGQDSGLIVLECPGADGLQAFAPADLVKLGIEERIVADGLQGGGELHVNQIAAVRKRAGFDALQSLGEDDAEDGVVAFKGIFADGLHGDAADGLGDLQIGVVLHVTVDGAGCRVEIEPVLVVLRLGDDRVLAAGLQMLRRSVGFLQRRGIGVQLVIRHVDRVILRHHEEAQTGLDEQRACALEADLLQVFAGDEGLVHDPDAGRNGHAGQRIAIREVAAEVLQPVVQRHAGQFLHRGDGAAVDRAQRIGHRQERDFVLSVKGVEGDGVDGLTVHIGGDRHIAAELSHQLQTVIAVVIFP